MQTISKLTCPLNVSHAHTCTSGVARVRAEWSACRSSSAWLETSSRRSCVAGACGRPTAPPGRPGRRWWRCGSGGPPTGSSLGVGRPPAGPRGTPRVGGRLSTQRGTTYREALHISRRLMYRCLRYSFIYGNFILDFISELFNVS